MSKTASVTLEGGATERRSERDSFSEAADAAARYGANAGFRALSDAWRLTNPTCVEQRTDFAYIQLLAGDAETALKSLALGSYGVERLPRSTRALLGACVAIEPSLAV